MSYFKINEYQTSSIYLTPLINMHFSIFESGYESAHFSQKLNDKRVESLRLLKVFKARYFDICNFNKAYNAPRDGTI